MKNITVNAAARVAEILIEGTIGVPEGTQFGTPGDRVATYETFQRVLGEIRSLDVDRVLVTIRSTGGSVNDALLIHDALAGLKAHITTRCFGYTASAATIIAQAASPGAREISANALYLIHQAAITAEGNVGEIRQTADMLSATDDRIADVYAKRSARGAKHFKVLMAENGGAGRWLSPREAVDYGLADKIVTPGNVRNSVAAAAVIKHEMSQITNLLKKQKMSNKKEDGPSLLARIGGFLANAAKFLAPVNFEYMDAEGGVLFSTESESDDLAVGSVVTFPDDTTTGGTFNLPDGRVVTITDLVVTEIAEAPTDEAEALRAENETLRGQLTEAVNLINDLKSRVTTNYVPQNRTGRPTMATRTVRSGAEAEKAREVTKDSLRDAVKKGF